MNREILLKAMFWMLVGMLVSGLAHWIAYVALWLSK